MVKLQVKKDTFKDVSNCQITKVSGQKTEIVDGKIHENKKWMYRLCDY